MNPKLGEACAVLLTIAGLDCFPSGRLGDASLDITQNMAVAGGKGCLE
ncbi:MAG: hypothetical protein AAGA69_10635 [Pseudomonadota bacterium]